MTKLYNTISLKQRRRDLRRNQPSPETLIWGAVRNRQILGYKFKRQFSIDPFIIDFYCPELKLAVEIDGDSHYEEGAVMKDRRRQNYLEKLGIKFLRFTNLDVSSNLEGVVETIERKIGELKTSSLPSPYQGEGVKPHPNPLLSKEGK